MKTKTYSFPSTSTLSTIYAWQWFPDDGDVKAVIQLHHGMAEHCGRYQKALEALTDMGYAVFMHDMLGHGKSCRSADDLGYFGDKDGYRFLIQDAKQLFDIARSEYPDKKIVIAGHSMGSFIMRCFTARYPSAGYSAAIYIGTAGPNPLAGASVVITNVLAALKGKKYRSKWLENTGFKGYNDKFEHRTDCDWLSRDKQSVDEYIDDKLCGFTFTVAAYNDLGHLLQECNQDSWYQNVPKDLPIMLASGDMDPVGDYAKGVKIIYDKLISTGHKDVEMKLYRDARHEILRELESEKFYRDIDKFITEKVLEK